MYAAESVKMELKSIWQPVSFSMPTDKLVAKMELDCPRYNRLPLPLLLPLRPTSIPIALEVAAVEADRIRLVFARYSHPVFLLMLSNPGGSARPITS